MTAIERLRALEKAVELVAKATPGPWEQGGGPNGGKDTMVYCDDSLGSAVATCGHDFTALISREAQLANANAIASAVNFIREHGSALIAELGQEVGAGKCEECGGFGEVCLAGRSAHPSNWHRCEACCQSSATSTSHTSEARDAARYRALKTHFQAKFHRATCDYWVIVGELKTDPRFIGEDGEQLTLDNALDAAIAAMRQEAE